MSGLQFECAQAAAMTSSGSVCARIGSRNVSRTARWICCVLAGSAVLFAGCATSSNARSTATEPAPPASTPELIPPRSAEGSAEATAAQATAAKATAAEAAPAEVIPPPSTSVDQTPAGASTGAPNTPAEAPAAPIEWLQFTPQIRVDRARGVIVCDIVSVLDVGFLEQYVCAVGTREHESLFVFEGKASELHAAMLLVGWTPGKPGSWREVPPQPTDAAEQARPTEEAQRLSDPTARNQRFVAVPPSGEALELTVVMPDGSTRPLTYFVRASPLGRPTTEDVSGEPTKTPTPPNRFIFAGSRFRTDPRTGVERYIADGSGSIVGLVTFGDETIAAVDVIPDQVSAAEPVWEVFTERMPKPGTRWTLRIERARPRRRRIENSLGAGSSVGNGSGSEAGNEAGRAERKKARPRQCLRPSPSGGEWMGRCLPTLCNVKSGSADSKCLLANSWRKVDITTDFEVPTERALRLRGFEVSPQALPRNKLMSNEVGCGPTGLRAGDGRDAYDRRESHAAFITHKIGLAVSSKEARPCIS